MLVRMGKIRAWERLDVILSEQGEDGLLENVATRLSEGESLKFIASSLALSYWVLWKWIDDDGERRRYCESAQKASAEDLAWEVLSIADGSTPDSVNVDKLRVDARKWMVPKLHQEKYGERAKVEVSGSVSLISLLSSLGKEREIEGEVVESVEHEEHADLAHLPSGEVVVPAEEVI
jgi:hypothetical protein